MPLVYAGASETDEPVSDRHERARKIKPQYAEGELVRVVGRDATRPRPSSSRAMLLEEGVPVDAAAHARLRRARHARRRARAT